jgi:hypothetical protein
MILSIHQFIEALTNTDGRFRTFGKVYPVEGSDGLPLFVMPGHGLVDFEVMADGEHLTLRCPLRGDAYAALRLRALAEKDRGLGSRFFTEWSVLESEVTLFDDDGKAFRVDILVRQAFTGERFTEFLQRAASERNVAAVEAVARSFGELTEWAQNAGRSGISARRLRVAPDGSLTLTAFSAGDESERIAEMIHLASMGGHVPELAEEEKREKASGYELDEGDGIRCVRDGGGWMYVDGRGRHIIDTVWLSAAPFREGRAEVETATGKGLIDREGRRILEPVYEELSWDDYFGLVAVMKEGRWWLLDRDGVMLTDESYDWLGECSEGLVLTQKDGKCGFLDTEGREAIPPLYDDATSFSEGCALVNLAGEAFCIDASGRRI